MIINDAATEYRNARKRGYKRYHEDLRKGISPYLKVLDEITSGHPFAGREEVGMHEIPIERIVGTVSTGRMTAFSSDFMPRLEEDTEFGMKWISLCDDHLSTTGIRDPIRCYEYMGDFYVQEGHKRVSVLSYFGAPTIMASVLRIVPVWNDSEETAAYYEFLDFFRNSKLYDFRFHKKGEYRRLSSAFGFAPDHKWTKEEQQKVQNLYRYFRKSAKNAVQSAGTTSEQAFLKMIETYSEEEIREMSEEGMKAAIEAAAAEVDAAVSVSIEKEPAEKSVLTKIVDAVFLPDHLSVAFIHALSPLISDWVAAHEEGRKYAESALSGKITAKSYVVSEKETADQLFAKAVEEGAQVIFATTPSLINACRKAAAAYPAIKILNCSVIMPYPGVRTYYSRIYEAKYISGAIAGAMTTKDRIGYIASSPIFGVTAGINAFALGVKLTNPRARIHLHWSCEEENPMEEIRKEDVDIISNRDLPIPGRPQEHWGLNRIEDNGTLSPLAAPYWNWGEFYTKLLSDILQGHWEDNAFRSGADAVNYWWGMHSGVVEIMLNDNLPEGVRSLAELLKKELSGESLLPFYRKIYSQDGKMQSNGTRLFTPEEILRMDWLCDSVNGEIPPFERILPMARSNVRLEGIYRDSLPPEEATTV